MPKSDMTLCQFGHIMTLNHDLKMLLIITRKKITKMVTITITITRT